MRLRRGRRDCRAETAAKSLARLWLRARVLLGSFSQNGPHLIQSWIVLIQYNLRWPHDSDRGMNFAMVSEISTSASSYVWIMVMLLGSPRQRGCDHLRRAGGACRGRGAGPSGGPCGPRG